MMKVVRAGLCSTFQDLGRLHLRDQGIAVGGAMDLHAHELANRLVDNEPGEATIELTLWVMSLSGMRMSLSPSPERI